MCLFLPYSYQVIRMRAWHYPRNVVEPDRASHRKQHLSVSPWVLYRKHRPGQSTPAPQWKKFDDYRGILFQMLRHQRRTSVLPHVSPLHHASINSSSCIHGFFMISKSFDFPRVHMCNIRTPTTNSLETISSTSRSPHALHGNYTITNVHMKRIARSTYQWNRSSSCASAGRQRRPSFWRQDMVL